MIQIDLLIQVCLLLLQINMVLLIFIILLVALIGIIAAAIGVVTANRRRQRRGPIFMHIAKCGGTSIRDIVGWDHTLDHCEALVTQNQSIINNSFCIVRNPFSRVVSSYFHILDETNPRWLLEKQYVKKFKSFEDFVMNGLTQHTIRRHVNHKQLRLKPFKDQTGGRMVRIPDWLPHFLPCTHYTHWDNGSRRIPNVYHLESDMAELLSALHMPSKHSNRSKHGHWREYYQGKPHLVQKIQDLYARDFQLLGYSHNIE